MTSHGDLRSSSPAARCLRALLLPVRALRRLADWLRYGRPGGYREHAFWEDRHRRYGSDFRAVAQSPDDEFDRYPAQKKQLLEILRECACPLAGKSCVEFGCGNGYWARVLLDNGAASCTGVDISPSAIAACLRRQAAPGAVFLCRDLAGGPVALDAPFDLVFSIDVIQHVLERPKLMTFLSNMQDAARPGGFLFVTSYTGWGDRPPAREGLLPALRFVTLWDRPTIEAGLPGCRLLHVRPFWDKAMLIFRRQPAPDGGGIA